MQLCSKSCLLGAPWAQLLFRKMVLKYTNCQRVLHAGKLSTIQRFPKFATSSRMEDRSCEAPLPIHHDSRIERARTPRERTTEQGSNSLRKAARLGTTTDKPNGQMLTLNGTAVFLDLWRTGAAATFLVFIAFTAGAAAIFLAFMANFFSVHNLHGYSCRCNLPGFHCLHGRLLSSTPMPPKLGGRSPRISN